MATLLSFTSDTIPTHLREQARWAPWRAIWNEKREKFDKVPHRADAPEYGLSTAKPDKWFAFDVAFRAYLRHPDMFAGIGYCMTQPHGVVGIDLDDCVENGKPAPWARDVIDRVRSYTEISPSGRGVRIMGLGDVLHDWNNHDTGIEVYGGNHPRFLTVTGARLPGSPHELRPIDPAVLAELAAQYARSKPQAEIIDLNMPDVLDELVLPDVETLELPPRARDFLLRGEHGDDRSGTLHYTAVSLFATGMGEQMVFSILANNAYAMEVALDHRRQDADRALLYLWREHTVKARGKASIIASADEFDVLEDEPAGSAADAPEKPLRFTVQQAGTFSRGKAPAWLIKGVLPHAELIVLFGESGSGKTFLTLDLSMSVARGVDWRGRRTKNGRVVYIAAEGGGGFRNRLTAYARQHEIELDELPFGVIHATPNFLQKDDALDVGRAIVAAGGADVIVVDTFAQVTPGANENAAEDVGKALAHCRGLHRATGAVVLLVHHAGKDSTKGARGWSGLRAAADAEIEVVRTPQGRLARVTKQKDGEDGLEFGFALESIVIGEDDDGDEVSSCVVLEAELPKAETPKARGPWERLAMVVLADFTGAQLAGIELEAVVQEMLRRNPAAEGEDDKKGNRATSARRAVRSICKDDKYGYALEEDDTITVAM